MKIEVVDKRGITNEPKMGSIIITDEGNKQLIIPFEEGFATYDLEFCRLDIFDDYEQYSENHHIDEVYHGDEIIIKLQKHN